MFNLKVSILLLGVAIAGCAGPQKLGGSPNVIVSETQQLPAPAREDLLSVDRPYQIGAFDKLVIDVFGIEDLSRKEVQADAGGRISFPLVGVVSAAGKTPSELAEAIEEGLRGRFVRDPRVTVNLKEAVSQNVTVDGEVKEPGIYPVVGRMTLVRAIAAAKGTSDIASLQHVAIFRSVKGQRMVGLYNLKAIRLGRYDDPEVYPNDVVVVGDSASRRFIKDAMPIVSAFTTPLVYILTR